MNFENKIVAIAGVAGGLGPTVAKAFASAGAIIAGNDVDLAKQEQLFLSLPNADRHAAFAVDLFDEAKTKSWTNQIMSRFGRVDVVLHLVGGWRGGKKIAEFPIEDYALLNKLLLTTTWNVIRAFVEPLKASQGRFIGVSSPQSQKPTHTNAAYAAFKAASETLTLALADEFKGTGATANLIMVNAILTPQMLAEKPDGNYKSYTSTDDIASAMLYLCSDAAKAMNGQRISLYGKN